jgi:CotH kinase protein
MDRSRLRGLLLAPLAALCGAFAAPASAELNAAAMYEPTTVVAIDLQLPPDSFEALEDDPDEYVVGTFALAETDGTPAGVGPYSAPIEVGIRLKGSIGSFRDLGEKAAFKVKFNEFVDGQKFLGLKKLTLNNMVQDPSMVHEALAYEAFGAAGIPVPRTGYAYVYVNGEDYGLHLNLETLDDVALKRIFGDFDDPQHLYEGGPEFDLLPGDLEKFEVDEGDEEELGDLEALIAAANSTAPEFSQRLAPVADLAQMTKMWAAERYLGQWDGYSAVHVNNYYLYSQPNGVFQMLPWGTDQALSHGPHRFTGPGGILFEQCLREPACFETYVEALVEVEESTSGLDPVPRVEALAAQLAPWQQKELAESTRAEHGAGAVAAGVDTTVEFLERRPAALAKWLAGEDDGTTPPGTETPLPPALAPTPANISSRLDLDRSQLGQGLLVANATLSGPGTITLVGTVGPAQDLQRACASKPRPVAAGARVLHCRLSSAIRARLADRALTLRLGVRFQPDEGGPAQTVTRPARLARQVLG